MQQLLFWLSSGAPLKSVRFKKTFIAANMAASASMCVSVSIIEPVGHLSRQFMMCRRRIDLNQFIMALYVMSLQ